MALAAIYAYAREIDDIADGELPPEQKAGELLRMREQLADLGAHRDPACVALADSVRRYPIPLDAFDELIDGVEMDLRAVEFTTFDELVGYCARVGGTIGRLCVGTFTTNGDADADRLATSLWIGLQLTNVLRDVREDADMGRIYLPHEDLRRFGVGTGNGGEGQPVGFAAGPQFDALMRFEVDRAAAYFAEGGRVLAMLDRSSAACMATMAGIYRRLLSRIADAPSRVLTSRVSLPTWEKVEIAARTLSGLPAGARSPFTHRASARFTFTPGEGAHA